MNIKRHIFDFIAGHHARVNHLPTQAEIRKFFSGLTEDVDLHLEQLQREGRLNLDGTGDGPISIPHTFPPARRINLSNPVGHGLNDVDNPLVLNTIGLDLQGAGVALDGELFAQVVRDDSMADAGIAAGDVAVLKVIPPERGEIVAVMEAGRLVLRRYVIVAGIPHHLAENPVRPDLTPAYDKPTHGVLWCLICTQPSGRSRPASPVKKGNYLREGMGGLESEFVAMLKPKLKAGPKAGPPPDAKGRGSKKYAAARKKPASRGYRWPEPLSGIDLNDKESSGYRAPAQRMICDEKLDRP